MNNVWKSYYYYAFLTLVGISFNQSSYYVDETNNRVQIEVYLSSPLPFDVNATINEVEKTATSQFVVLYEYMHIVHVFM